MLEDALEINSQLLESDSPVTWQGKHFALDEAILLPRPQRKTPIMIGGRSKALVAPCCRRHGPPP